MANMKTAALPAPRLRRTISLPLLVFYGVGVTIGAGIFALIGEVLAIAGDHAVWSFLLAGLVAGFTGFSYVLLASAYPRAAGEAVFVKIGLGAWAGRIVGYAVVAVAITSSAVIALAFSRYFSSFTGVPESAGLVAIVALLCVIAMMGVRESVAFAALITLLEVGTLLVVIAVNYRVLADGDAIWRAIAPPTDVDAVHGVAVGAFLAFFAFIGFEDIENMAEETHDAHRNVPLAIILTLIISVAIYALVAIAAAAFPDRAMLTASKAPLADLYESATGRPGGIIAAMATVAMINGILVQIVMAARVMYGMAQERLMPSWAGILHETRQTPVRATLLVSFSVAALALFVPLLQLAELTSLVMLLIFATVNISLTVIGGHKDAPRHLKRWRWWGVPGALIALALVAAQLLT
jgi:basic amino acid/polyamine antiporter, APA family